MSWPLTLYPPASFIAVLQSFEIVGVAPAAPIEEKAAALRVPVIVITGDPGPTVPLVKGQEADLCIVSY